MRRVYRINTLLVVLCLTISCAAGTQGAAERPRRSRNAITIEEIRSVQALTNAYDIVQRLRPRWLRPRGPASFSGTAPVIVYVDNVRAGLVDVLYGIPVEWIIEIRGFDASDATNRWGTGLAGGAIEVVTLGSRPAN